MQLLRIRLGSRLYFITADFDDVCRKLVNIFYFEDASEVLLLEQELAETFLRGTWKTEGGSYYFTMKSGGRTSYDLPWINYGDYYTISDGTYYLYNEGDADNKKDQFTFRLLTPDSMEVFCHKNSRTYTLYRQ